MKKVVIQFVTFAGVKPVHQEAQSSAIFGLSWKDSTCNSCSSTGESLYTMTQSNRKGCGFLHTSSKNRVDPEAVTEEDSESPLHCAWQGDHISTMAVLAEVVDARGCSELSIGDWVLPATPMSGTWQTHKIFQETQLIKE